MNNNSLEKHILSRSYSPEAKVLEVLSSRYSVTGDQRPSLILTPTGTPSEKSASTSTSLLHRKTGGKGPKSSKSANTRLELKKYIATTLQNQRKLTKIINQTRRKSARGSISDAYISSKLSQFQIPRFEEFTGLNNLWQEYMKNLLFSSPLQQKIPSLTMMLPKLTSADYTGCLLTVLQAKNSQLVGTRGIVVWDTQYLFILCIPRDQDSKEYTETIEDSTELTASTRVGGLKAIPKKGCIFGFDVITDEQKDECLSFNIIGSRFEFRNVDRSSKKFKNHNVDDLL